MRFPSSARDCINVQVGLANSTVAPKSQAVVLPPSRSFPKVFNGRLAFPSLTVQMLNILITLKIHRSYSRPAQKPSGKAAGKLLIFLCWSDRFPTAHKHMFLGDRTPRERRPCLWEQRGGVQQLHLLLDRIKRLDDAQGVDREDAQDTRG